MNHRKKSTLILERKYEQTITAKPVHRFYYMTETNQGLVRLALRAFVHVFILIKMCKD